MEDICERVYNSPQFYINREKLINKGKSKEEIFNIIKIHLSNISTKTHDLDTVVKSQIIEILKETYNGDINDAVHSVFKNYYFKHPDKLRSHLELFKEFCEKNSNIKIEELIMSLFMNVETRSIEKISHEITYYVKNEFKESQSKNDRIYTEYFQENESRQEHIQQDLNISKKDIKKLLSSYQRLDQCLKTQTKSNIDLINHIVNDRLTKNEALCQKKLDTSIKNEYEKLNEKMNDIITKIIHEKLNENLDDKITEVIDERFSSIINRISKLENSLQDMNKVFIKEKQSLHDKIKNSSISLDKFKIEIKKLNEIIQKNNKTNCLSSSKLNQRLSKLERLSTKDKGLNKDTNEKITKDLTLIKQTIKSISAQNAMKQSLIFEEIDRNIHDKFKYYNTNGIISQLQCEIVKLRAEIDLIYRNQQQNSDFYSGYHM